MRIIFFVQPKAVATIDRNYKELTISFLLHFHCMKFVHDVRKAILSFATLRLNIDQVLFHLCSHDVLRTESIIEQKRGLWRPLVTDFRLSLTITTNVVFNFISTHTSSSSGICKIVNCIYKTFIPQSEERIRYLSTCN